MLLTLEYFDDTLGSHAMVSNIEGEGLAPGQVLHNTGKSIHDAVVRLNFYYIRGIRASKPGGEACWLQIRSTIIMGIFTYYYKQVDINLMETINNAHPAFLKILHRIILMYTTE